MRMQTMGGSVRAAWGILVLAAGLSACGGGGGSAPNAVPAPPPPLELHLHGPEQVQAGDAVLVTGALSANGVRPETMSWSLLERPADSQTVLGAAAGSSQQLRTDAPGRYVLQWTATTADGQVQRRQWAVEAVAGPVILTSTGEGRLVTGQPATLLATRPDTSAAAGLTSYRWTLVDAPAGGSARLSGEWGQEVRLTTDRPGSYQVAVESRQGTTVSRTVRTLSSVSQPSYTAIISRLCHYMVPDCQIPQGVASELSGYVFDLPDTAAVTYRWTLLSAPAGSTLAGTKATGPKFLFTPDVVGGYGMLIEASSPVATISSSVQFLNVTTAPTGRIEGPTSALVGQLVTLDARGNRTPYGSPTTGMTHEWTILKAPKGSSAALTTVGYSEQTPKFRPDRPGEYVIGLGVATLKHYARFLLQVTSADPTTVYAPKVLGYASPLLPGEAVQLSAQTQSELGHPLVYAWKFGDGSSATGESVTHAFSYPGTYQVQVTVTDTLTQRFARQTQAVMVVAERKDNIDPSPCRSITCGASGPGTYAGQGFGRWQLFNDRPHMQLANLDIAGVQAGQRVMISLTNATGSPAGMADLGQVMEAGAAIGLPAGGPIAPMMNSLDYRTSLMQARSDLLKRRDEAHAAHLESDRAAVKALRDSFPRVPGGRRQALSAAPRQPAVLPEIGTSRVWHDTSSSADYDTRLHDTCLLPGGRAVLFWIDGQALKNSLLTTEQVSSRLKPMACGEQGGFHRLQQVLGAEVFGPHGDAVSISDQVLQPVNVLLVDPGDGVYWGAFVHGVNHWKSSYYSRSNEALVMYVNARYMHEEPDFLASSLVHEFMHLINIYQRTMLNELGRHDTWLEETTAMMAEDLLNSSLIRNADGSRFAPMAMRIESYQSTWSTSRYLGGDGANYSVGGSLAAFLDRRLGAALLRGLTLECTNGPAGGDSLAYLDDQVFKRSGRTLAESYAAMNLSLMAPVNNGEATELGMPAYASEDVDLPSITLTASNMIPRDGLPGPWIMGPGAHAYRWDTVTPAMAGRYRRQGILVPSGHVLQVLIR